MKFIFFFLLSIALFLSCKQKQIDVSFLKRDLKDSQKIKWLLADEQLSLLGINESGSQFLKTFYGNRGFKSCWIKDSSFSEKGMILTGLLKNPLAFGLPDKRYEISAREKHYLVNELKLTYSLALIFQDLHTGLFNFKDSTLRPISFPAAHEFVSGIKFKHKNKDSIALDLIKWGPTDSNFRKLALRLFSFASSHPLNEQDFKVPTEKKDSILAHSLARKSLEAKGYLSTDTADSALYWIVLRQFQEESGLEPDGVIGKFTADALNESNTKKCRRVALTLEKLRHRSVSGIRLMEVNIPEYILRFYADDSLKSVNRVIVGKFDKSTPEFSAVMRKIVVYPYWHVPYSIRSEEMLPDAKKNPGYFAKNHMILYSKDNEIDPYSVNWSNIRKKTFPYSVVQQPGSHNSLGIIKFEFSNPYGVYIHDTPSKSLFKKDIRSFSHGCIRCENPVELAKTILFKDANPKQSDSLDSILLRKQNHPVLLKKSIQVSIVYRSVTLNQMGNIVFLRDIYKRDEYFLRLLFQV